MRIKCLLGDAFREGYELIVLPFTPTLIPEFDLGVPTFAVAGALLKDAPLGEAFGSSRAALRTRLEVGCPATPGRYFPDEVILLPVLSRSLASDGRRAFPAAMSAAPVTEDDEWPPSLLFLCQDFEVIELVALAVLPCLSRGVRVGLELDDISATELSSILALVGLAGQNSSSDSAANLVLSTLSFRALRRVVLVSERPILLAASCKA